VKLKGHSRQILDLMINLKNELNQYFVKDHLCQVFKFVN
jgi:hypothetical protein